ncbi:hypothetical protein FACS1894161_5450 [Spirochaetia bacterium]|nr:hypothetical protein FACS1894161_5450 [Spirochaetia bacterium]
MIQKKHFHILEAISVLMFAVLANFIFGLKIDFGQKINWIQVVQLIVLSISTFRFYFMVYKLKYIYEESEKDYNSEMNLEVKANYPIEKRYKTKYDKEKVRIILMAIISGICALLFFLVEPVTNYCIRKILER